MGKDFTSIQFGKSLRGYTTDDVDNYLQYVNTEFRKLERHCTDSDKKLVFALRKLEALTKEMQKIYEITDLSQAGGVVQDPEPSRQTAAPVSDEKLKAAEEELKKAKEEIEKARSESVKLRTESELRANELLSAARERAGKIIEDAKAQSAQIISSASKKARSAAEQIITDAALAGRKIIREAEDKADEACRDVLDIHKSAGEIYDEIASFRNSLFGLYNSHIESIENITGHAQDLVYSVDDMIHTLEKEDNSKPVAAEPETTVEDSFSADEEPAAAPYVSEPVIEETITEEEPVEEISLEEESVSETESEDNIESDEAESFALSEPVEEEDILSEETLEIAEEEKDELQISMDEAIDSVIEVEEKAEEEYYDSFDMPEDEDELVPAEEPIEEIKAEDEIISPASPETVSAEEESDTLEIGNIPEENDKDTDDYSLEINDFELPEDAGNGGTSVLDIVKKLGDGAPQKKADSDFNDFEELFSSSNSVSSSEFNRVFSNSDIEAIMRQPLVAPEEPTNPHKHSKF